MIKIIAEPVKMPALERRRFQKECKNAYGRSEKWFVVDAQTKTVRYKGNFENASLACHNLNKKHYENKN